MKRLWVVPLLGLGGGIVLCLATLGIDRAIGYGAIGQAVTGNPSAAQTVLQQIAQSVFTLASVVLSLTLVAVQVAMGQFSPRIVQALLNDHRSRVAMALFLGTFSYSMFALRVIDSQSSALPGLTILVGYLLGLASVGALLLYIQHTAQSLRVGGLIDFVGDETRRQLDQRYAVDERLRPRPEEGVVLAEGSGNVVTIDDARLVALAERADCVIELLPTMGEFVCQDAPLARIHGEAARIDRSELVAAIGLERERTHESDPAYGIRKLVDIAERAVAEPFDDPTTAVQALDRIHDCLRLLAHRAFPSGRHRDAHGEVRVIERVLTWDGFVRLAFDEIRLAGATSPQVARKLRSVLEDLLGIAPDERREPLQRQIGLLEAAVRDHYDADDDAAAAAGPDPLGLGAGRDVLVSG
jgi:uncharacterized membrane protein